MKKLNIRILPRNHRPDGFEAGAKKLGEVLKAKTKVGDRIIAYSDGSTEVHKKKQHPNSGYAVVITDIKHRPICELGGMVKTDGNNFLAEMAAVTMALNALPPGRYLDIYSDSQATLAAIQKPPSSERKRIRAPGRAWKNQINVLLEKKKHFVNFHHIKSHQEITNPNQWGNDRADHIAKIFLEKGKSKTIHYTLLREENFLMFFKTRLVEGDIRSFLKKQEKEILFSVWRKQQRQGRLFRKFPRQIMKLSKDVWSWAVSRNEGKAWLFWIFAISDWLPTNFRLHRRDGKSQICDLCQSGSVEDIRHLFSCPATATEQNNLRMDLEYTMAKWNIPYFQLGSSPHLHTKQGCLSFLLPKLAARGLVITKEKLQQLINDYFGCENKRKPKNLNHLHRHIQIALLRASCSCNSTNHQCHLKYSWTTPPSLVKILKTELSLEVDGMADSLHHSEYLASWFSKLSSDCVFGAKWNFFEQTLEGKNIFICPPFEVHSNGENLITKVIQKIVTELKTDKPTRALLIIPILEGREGHIFETQARKAKFLEICRFPKDCFPFDAPEAFQGKTQPILYPGKIALYLAANRASLRYDPISWDSLINKLQDWSKTFCKQSLVACNLTGNKFLERKLPAYSSREPTQSPKIFEPSSIYNYYDFRSSSLEPVPLQHNILNTQHLNLITSLTKHDKLAGLLGILPPPLLSLLKETHPQNFQVTLELQSQTIWGA